MLHGGAGGGLRRGLGREGGGLLAEAPPRLIERGGKKQYGKEYAAHRQALQGFEEMALPWASVTVTMVLLKEERIWTWPRSMFFRSRRRRMTFLPPDFCAAILFLPPDILAKSGVNPDTRVKDLTDADEQKLRDAIGRWFCCAGPGRAGPCGGAGRGSSRFR